MCWNSRYVPRRMVAEKDLIVYKVFTFSLISPIVHKKYRLHKKNKEIKLDVYKGWIFPRSYWQITNGYHSFTTIDACAKFAVDVVLKEHRDWPKIYECVVPAGSEYYVNDDDEIVSSNIIINKYLTLNVSVKL